MPEIAQFCLGAVLATVVGMIVAFALVRLAANIVIVLIGLGACGLVLFKVTTGEWGDWGTVITGSLVTGLAAALLCLPALPFTSMGRKNKG